MRRLILCLVVAALVTDWPVSGAQPQMSPVERKKVHDRQFSGQGGDIQQRLGWSDGDIEYPTYESMIGHDGFRSVDSMSETLACNSHVIVIGRLMSSVSEATELGTTVYTTWTVEASEVLKSPVANAVTAGTRVDVLVNGGSVLVGTRRVTVTNPLIPALRLDRKFLMFLSRIEQTGAFRGYFVDVTDEYLVGSVERSAPDLTKTKTITFLKSLRGMIPSTFRAGSGCVPGAFLRR